MWKTTQKSTLLAVTTILTQNYDIQRGPVTVIRVQVTVLIDRARWVCRSTLEVITWNQCRCFALTQWALYCIRLSFLLHAQRPHHTWQIHEISSTKPFASVYWNMGAKDSKPSVISYEDAVKRGKLWLSNNLHRKKRQASGRSKSLNWNHSRNLVVRGCCVSVDFLLRWRQTNCPIRRPLIAWTRIDDANEGEKDCTSI